MNSITEIIINSLGFHRRRSLTDFKHDQNKSRTKIVRESWITTCSEIGSEKTRLKVRSSLTVNRQCEFACRGLWRVSDFNLKSWKKFKDQWFVTQRFERQCFQVQCFQFLKQQFLPKANLSFWLLLGSTGSLLYQWKCLHEVFEQMQLLHTDSKYTSKFQSY